MLRKEMHHRSVVKFIGQQFIVGKYGTSSICSPLFVRSFHVSIMCFLRSPRATCNYRILFYSVSDYINKRKIINQ